MHAEMDDENYILCNGRWSWNTGRKDANSGKKILIPLINGKQYHNFKGTFTRNSDDILYNITNQ